MINVAAKDLLYHNSFHIYSAPGGPWMHHSFSSYLWASEIRHKSAFFGDDFTVSFWERREKKVSERTKRRVTSRRFTWRSDTRADCVHTLLSEVCTAPHREEEEGKKKKNLGRSGDENRWWNSVRNTGEKNNRHLLVKPNLVPPSHSSRVQLTERRRQTDRYLYIWTLEDRRKFLINTD